MPLSGRKLWLAGIGGAGMSGYAILAKAWGAEVSGWDRRETPYLAGVRAAGIPARAAAGLALVGTKFYYHAWPEVFVGKWVAVDPTFGQFPADASHLRFVTGGLGRQADLLRLVGNLRIQVLGTR